MGASLEAVQQPGVHPVLDLGPLVGLGELQHLRHIALDPTEIHLALSAAGDVEGPQEHLQGAHGLKALQVQVWSAVLGVAVHERLQKRIPVPCKRCLGQAKTTFMTL